MVETEKLCRFRNIPPGLTRGRGEGPYLSANSEGRGARGDSPSPEAFGFDLSPHAGRGKRRSKLRRMSGAVAPSHMRQIVRERVDFLIAEGKGDVRHRRAGAADPLARLVVMQRLDQIFLALAGQA